MKPQRIAVKFFTSPDPRAPVDLAPFTPLFHEFIQKARVEGLLIDVADYAHVPEGPGIILIGHEVDYGLDRAEGRAGLLTLRKRYGQSELGEVLRDTLRKALGCIVAIEQDGRTGLRFGTAALEIQILDRLAAPNDERAFEAARAAAAPVIETLLPGAAIERASADDARRPLTLDVSSAAGGEASELLQRLA